jgi:ATP-dependent Lon protease
MFVTTANMLDPIQPAFRDRMEIIQLSGYTEEEKLQIAKRHLIPKQVEAHGLKKNQIQFTDDGVRAIINQYTQEAGLRNLEREIAAVCRKVAKQIAIGEKKVRKIHTDNLDQFLGRPKVFQEDLLKRDQVGVATGLAWTPVGGDVLFVEATAMEGTRRSDADRTTGRCHERSPRTPALSYARSQCKRVRNCPRTSSPRTISMCMCPRAQSRKGRSLRRRDDGHGYPFTPHTQGRASQDCHDR